jgi:hypothetical protein
MRLCGDSGALFGTTSMTSRAIQKHVGSGAALARTAKLWMGYEAATALDRIAGTLAASGSRPTGIPSRSCHAARRAMNIQKYGVRATQALNILDEAHDEESNPVKAAVLPGRERPAR